MDDFANELIDALGGTTATAAAARTGVSTVHNWRKNGLPPSRLDHLRRIVLDDFPAIDVAALAAKHDVNLPDVGVSGEGGVADHDADSIDAAAIPSSGTPADLSQPVSS